MITPGAAVRQITEKLTDEGLVACARQLAKDIRKPMTNCPGEPEAAAVLELLADRLEAVNRATDAKASETKES